MGPSRGTPARATSEVTGGIGGRLYSGEAVSAASPLVVVDREELPGVQFAERDHGDDRVHISRGILTTRTEAFITTTLTRGIVDKIGVESGEIRLQLRAAAVPARPWPAPASLTHRGPPWGEARPRIR